MFEKIEAQSSSALENYKLSQDAFNYTLSIIEGSSTRLSPEEEMSDSNKIVQRINLMRAEPLHHEEYTLGWISEVAALTLKHRVGNCCEQACSVLNYLALSTAKCNSGYKMNMN